MEKHASRCIFPSISSLNPVKNGDIPDRNSPSGSGNVSCGSLLVSTPTKSGITAESQTPSREQFVTCISVETQTPTKGASYESDSDVDFSTKSLHEFFQEPEKKTFNNINSLVNQNDLSTSLDVPTISNWSQSELESQCIDSNSSMIVIEQSQLDSNPIMESKRKVKLRGKRRSRLSFDINNMLNNVEEGERTKVIMSSIVQSNTHMTNFQRPHSKCTAKCYCHNRRCKDDASVSWSMDR